MILGCPSWPLFNSEVCYTFVLIQDGWPEEAICCFDDDAYERDARYDYVVLGAPDGVFMFRNC